MCFNELLNRSLSLELKIVVWVLVFAPFFTAVTPTATLAQENTDKNQDITVVVRSGDTLSLIVARVLGRFDRDTWGEVAEYNKIADPGSLEVGAILLIPRYLRNKPLDPSVNAQVDDICGGQQVCFQEKATQSAVANDLISSEDSSPAVESRPQAELSFRETSKTLETVDRELERGPTADSEPHSGASQQPEFNSETTDATDPDGTDVPSVSSPDNTATNADPVQQENEDPDASVTNSETGAESAPQQKPASEQENNTDDSDTGNTRSPGSFDVDEDAATRALERTLVQLDALLLEPGRVEAGLDISYTFDARITPVLIDVTADDGSTNTAVGLSETRDNNLDAILDLRIGLPFDAQLNIDLPVVSDDREERLTLAGTQISSENNDISGFGDISVTVVKKVFAEKGRRPDLLVSAGLNTDTGSESDTRFTGSGANELIAGLTATKRQDPLVFTAGVTSVFPQEEDNVQAGQVTQLSISTLLAASPRTSLQFSFDQTFIGELTIDDEDIEGTDTSFANFTVGASSVIGRQTFLSAAATMGLTDDATDYTLSIGISRQFRFR